MTKHLLLLLLSLLGLLSCQESAEQRTLQQAAELVFHQPDSALTLLQQIPSPERLPAKTFADYSLLMTEALDRCDHPLPDTLLHVAADYYLERKDNPVQTAKTCYYLGRFNMETGYAKEAQSFYMKGLEALKEEKEYRLKGVLHYYLGVLYRRQKLYENAIVEHKKSYSYSSKLNNIEDIAYDLQEIGQDFSSSDQMDSALYYYSEILSIVKDTNRYKRVFATTFNDIAVAYRDLQDYEKALSYINKAIKYADPSEVATSYLVKGKIFLYANRYDSAAFYMAKCIQSPSAGIQKDAYFCLYQIRKAENDLQEAIRMNDLFLAKQDSALRTQQTEVLANIDKRYQHEQIINKNKDLKIKLHRAKGNLYLGLFIICLTIIVSIYGYKKMKKRQELLIEETTKKIEKNKQTIAQKEEAIRSQNLVIQENKCLLEQQMSHLEKLQQDLIKTHEVIDRQDKDLFAIQQKEYLFRKELFFKTKAHERIAECLTCSNHILNKNDELLIIDTVNNFFSNFIQTINLDKNLTTGNLCFCCILKLYPELTTEQLAQMYNVSHRSIEQRKYRLKKELIGENDDKRLRQFLAEL